MTTKKQFEYKEDPRWIVRDLGEEGKNVGKWHW